MKSEKSFLIKTLAIFSIFVLNSCVNLQDSKKEELYRNSDLETPVNRSTLSPWETPTPSLSLHNFSELNDNPDIKGLLTFQSRREDTNNDNLIDNKDGVNIYKLNLETNDIIRLTSGNQIHLSPAWAPDGRKIAFVSNETGNFEIFTVDVDGTNLRQLTNTPEDEDTPVWSPDGMQIAYVKSKLMNSGLKERHIYVIDLATGSSHLLIQSSEESFQPDWSSDGEYLMFLSSDSRAVQEHAKVNIYNLITQKYIDITELNDKKSFRAPQWIPCENYQGKEDRLFSVTQVPGDFASTEIKVFRLTMKDEFPVLSLVVTLEDGIDPYSWVCEPLGIVMPFENSFSNKAFNPNNQSVISSFDLIFVPVDFQEPYIESPYSIDKRPLITDNEFYDFYPDWISLHD